MRHLAIFHKNLAEAVITGEKVIDLRFSKRKIVPFGQVSAGDEVLVKVRGSKIFGKFIVDRVAFYDHPSQNDLIDLKKKLSFKSKIEEDIWKADANYLTIIYIGQTQRFLVSPQLEKRDLRGWVIL